MNIYRERAALIAFLAKHYPSVLAYNDPNEPDWAVIHLDTSEGRIGWHIAESDLDLFVHVPFLNFADAPMWVEYTTEEKYERLGRLPTYAADEA